MEGLPPGYQVIAHTPPRPGHTDTGLKGPSALGTLTGGKGGTFALPKVIAFTPR